MDALSEGGENKNSVSSTSIRQRRTSTLDNAFSRKAPAEIKAVECAGESRQRPIAIANKTDQKNEVEEFLDITSVGGQGLATTRLWVINHSITHVHAITAGQRPGTVLVAQNHWCPWRAGSRFPAHRSFYLQLLRKIRDGVGVGAVSASCL